MPYSWRRPFCCQMGRVDPLGVEYSSGASTLSRCESFVSMVIAMIWCSLTRMWTERGSGISEPTDWKVGDGSGLYPFSGACSSLCSPLPNGDADPGKWWPRVQYLYPPCTHFPYQSPSQNMLVYRHWRARIHHPHRLPRGGGNQARVNGKQGGSAECSRGSPPASHGERAETIISLMLGMER